MKTCVAKGWPRKDPSQPPAACPCKPMWQACQLRGHRLGEDGGTARMSDVRLQCALAVVGTLARGAREEPWEGGFSALAIGRTTTVGMRHRATQRTATRGGAVRGGAQTWCTRAPM